MARGDALVDGAPGHARTRALPLVFRVCSGRSVLRRHIQSRVGVDGEAADVLRLLRGLLIRRVEGRVVEGLQELAVRRIEAPEGIR